MLGQSVRLQPVPIQSLSELERARLQDVACYHLEKRDLDFNISIPREIRKRRKSLRRSLTPPKRRKERTRDSRQGVWYIPLPGDSQRPGVQAAPGCSEGEQKRLSGSGGQRPDVPG
nr:rho GTPase-activating protein 6-like isoform X2 [Salvelinus alpinus]